MSTRRKFIIGALAFLVCIFPDALRAGTSGMVSGFVRDKETGMALPGAAVIVENTTFGATADKYGFYIIYNLPVGNYNLRATMIGYLPTKVTEVEVKTDINTPVSFALAAQALQVEQEIVVIAPRVKIYKDVNASVHFFDAQELAVALPAQNFQDALPLTPGFVANHFRGGRAANALYLIDGLPASGPLTRDLAFSVRNTAIAEMMVQTGGFNAEYGNVSAGLVNIITKEGRNDFEGIVKLATDVVGRKESGFENTRRAEFAVTGPLTLGLGGPVVETNYLISGGLNLSDTPHQEALRQAFKSPVLFNYDLNAKLVIRAAPNVYLRLQTLLSNYDWRKYDAQWEGRLSALPKRENRNIRLSASLTHTLNSSTFYKLDLVGMELRRQVLGDLPTTAPPNLILQNQSLAAAWPGYAEPWNEQTVERQLTVHWNLVRQLQPAHQLQVGIEANAWDLSMHRLRYLLLPLQKDKTSWLYSRYNDAFRQFPFTLAGYLQHKIEKRNFIVRLGLRYEAFSPNARQTTLLAADSASIFKGDKGRFKQTLAPRLSLAIPISSAEHLSFNYGWFYEMPPFYYLYMNRTADQGADWPLFGNVDLKPLRSQSWEAIYRRVVSPQSIYSLTYFHRNYVDLLDTSPYSVPNDGAASDPKTIARFENRARAYMNGLELAIKHDFGKGSSGVLSYTYLRSFGSASWPESNWIKLARGESPADNHKQPLAWDQRHTFNYDFNFVSRHGWRANIFGKINSPAVVMDWLTGDQYNLSVRHDLDLKIVAPMRWAGLPFEPFLEIHNVFDGKYVTPGEGGLDFSQPNSLLRNQFGRQIWVGITYR
jgi:outer membrane receptor for ferrienterochelin and colicin